MFRIVTLFVWAMLLLMPVTSMAEEVVFDKIVVKINDEISRSTILKKR